MPRALSPPPPSSLTSHISSTTSDSTTHTHAQHLHHLAAQVLHNLKYEHNWQDLRIHTHAPVGKQALLPRPIISGQPPHRIYTHPDLQRALLKRGMRDEDLAPETLWVVPSVLRERWSLEMFAGVFDGLPEREEVVLDEEGEEEGEDAQKGQIMKEAGDAEKPNWDSVKRLLLATVEEDSTVVYYVVHDGVVKPRQN